MLAPRIAMAFLASLLVFNPLFGGSSTPRRIEITASRFSYSPNTITLKKDESVILVFRSADVTHGLKVPDLNISTEIKKGKDAELPFTPTKTGHFMGKCVHFCGSGHGSMIFEIDVVD